MLKFLFVVGISLSISVIEIDAIYGGIGISSCSRTKKPPCKPTKCPLTKSPPHLTIECPLTTECSPTESPTTKCPTPPPPTECSPTEPLPPPTTTECPLTKPPPPPPTECPPPTENCPLKLTKPPCPPLIKFSPINPPKPLRLTSTKAHLPNTPSPPKCSTYTATGTELRLQASKACAKYGYDSQACAEKFCEAANEPTLGCSAKCISSGPECK